MSPESECCRTDWIPVALNRSETASMGLNRTSQITVLGYREDRIEIPGREALGERRELLTR